MKPLTWTRPPDLPHSHYLDNRIYTDAHIFELERRSIFAARWKLICHNSEMPEPGDYRTFSVAGYNLLAIRGEDKEVRVFHNICPHRGAALVRSTAGKVNRGRIQCFYHLWAFDATGRCVTIPRRQGYASCGLTEKHVHLRRVRSETRLGFIWICLSDDVEPIDEFLGPISPEIEAALTTEEVDVFHFHRAEFKANWKLFVETNCEGYHELLHLLNRTTGLGQDNYANRRWRIHAWGHNSLEPFEIGYDRLALDQRNESLFPGMQPNGHVVVDVFPDVMFNIRATVGRVDTLTPIKPGLTLLECRGIGLKRDTPEERSSRIRQHNQVWGPSGRNLPEDLWAIETQWSNIASGAYPYSLIAREEGLKAMDDGTLRNFYHEWSRLLERYPHNIDAQWSGLGTPGRPHTKTS